MGPFVPDASITLAWLLPDEGTAATDLLLRHSLTDGLIAPSVWTYEVSNILSNALKRGRLQQSQADAALDVLDRLPIVRIPDEVGDLVRCVAETGLTSYDAAYIALAERENLPLATLDRRMRDAATERGITVLPQA